MAPVMQLVVFFTCMAILLFIFTPKIVAHCEKKKKKTSGRGTFTQQYLEKRALDFPDDGATQVLDAIQTKSSHRGLAVRMMKEQHVRNEFGISEEEKVEICAKAKDEEKTENRDGHRSVSFAKNT